MSSPASPLSATPKTTTTLPSTSPPPLPPSKRSPCGTAALSPPPPPVATARDLDPCRPPMPALSARHGAASAGCTARSLSPTPSLLLLRTCREPSASPQSSARISHHPKPVSLVLSQNVLAPESRTCPLPPSHDFAPLVLAPVAYPSSRAAYCLSRPNHALQAGGTVWPPVGASPA
jgi:hypothetical protein